LKEEWKEETQTMKAPDNKVNLVVLHSLFELLLKHMWRLSKVSFIV
jgi:hypothetical protein